MLTFSFCFFAASPLTFPGFSVTHVIVYSAEYIGFYAVWPRVARAGCIPVEKKKRKRKKNEEASDGKLRSRWGREELTLKLANACKKQATSAAPWRKARLRGLLKFFNTFEGSSP